LIEIELQAARGLQEAELVLKNGTIINVFTETLQQADVAICNGKIIGIGSYHGKNEIDCTGKFVAPGFIDGHIHLESSMLTPMEFTKAVLSHGTTTVITDPHEIANVCGLDGIEYMMEASKGLPLDIFFLLPSCVPATSYEESGFRLTAKDLAAYYFKDTVLGLAEVMDYNGAIHGDREILHKIADAKEHNKVIDGHGPELRGKDACAYIMAGIRSDHECTDIEEALEKLSLGQWIMVREGTAAKNLTALKGLFQPPYHQRVILVTDDKHPQDILEHGHMDDLIRMAIANGADPCIAIKTATFNTASYFRLENTGAIAPGYNADVVILSDLREVKVEKVIKDGKLVVNQQVITKLTKPDIPSLLEDKVYHSFHCKELQPDDFKITPKKDINKATACRVIQFISGELLTKELQVPLKNGKPDNLPELDILKLAVIERHHHTNHIGLGFVTGYGLTMGAIASSVAHDSHNLIVIGTNDEDMAAAANCIREMQGGWAIANHGKIVDKLPLTIAGLMSTLDAETLSENIAKMKQTARSLGVEEGIDPFMTLAFVSLPVIPELRLITTGLIDVRKQCHVSLFI
jgi:adenine deaminase